MTSQSFVIFYFFSSSFKVLVMSKGIAPQCLLGFVFVSKKHTTFLCSRHACLLYTSWCSFASWNWFPWSFWESERERERESEAAEWSAAPEPTDRKPYTNRTELVIRYAFNSTSSGPSTPNPTLCMADDNLSMSIGVISEQPWDQRIGLYKGARPGLSSWEGLSWQNTVCFSIK